MKNGVGLDSDHTATSTRRGISPPRNRFSARWWTCGACCLLLAIVHTWPLATAPATLSRNDNGDAQLNEWIMAWVAHQLPRAPTRLFQANIFYPAQDVLAYSEPLIVPALIGAPLQWIGASPVLAFNIVLIAGFALTVWGGYTLVHAWTRDPAGAFLTGSILAFNTHTLTRLPHIQAVHGWGLPLALLATDRLIVHARWRDGVWLAVWMTAMAYTSGYLVVFAVVMIAVAVLVRALEWWPRARAVLFGLVLATVLSAVATLPVSLPYRRVAREQGMVRSLEAVGKYSATPQGYLATDGRIHFTIWSNRFFKDPVDAFFPGFIVIALAGLALWSGVRATGSTSRLTVAGLTRRRIAMLLAIAVIGFTLSLGTRTPLYAWLYRIFPPLQGIRAAARFGNLFLLGVTALAGVGLAMLRQRVCRSIAQVLGIVCVLVANVESLRAPFDYRRFDGIPGIYSLLARDPGRVVLVEAPFYPPQAVFENAEYVLASTAHWRNLMNGYSGYTPLSYREYAASFWFFPEEHAIQAMRRAGVTHIMVHPYRFYQDADKVMARVAASPYLERLAVGRRGMTLYRLK